MARGTSQACSHRSQELYFRMIQTLKETIKAYEDEQGVQYGENAVHLDRDLVGPILATFVHLQRELQVTRDSRQQAWDREVDAKIHRKEAEQREAQLKCDLGASRDETFRAQETAREQEKKYHETLVLLRQAQVRTRLLPTQKTTLAISRWKRNLMTLSSNWTDYARNVLRARSVGR